VVNELYRHMLERTAGEASVGWVRQLENGRMTVRDVVREIATSPEHLNRFFYTEFGEQTPPYYRSVGSRPAAGTGRSATIGSTASTPTTTIASSRVNGEDRLRRSLASTSTMTTC
jgi:hypothetical protein